MKRIGLFAIAFALLGAGEPLATQRHVAGVITQMDASALTIASAQQSVSGRIDPARTRITAKGKPASLADLQITAHARGELCLDDVWLAIDTH